MKTPSHPNIKRLSKREQAMWYIQCTTPSGRKLLLVSNGGLIARWAQEPENAMKSPSKEMIERALADLLARFSHIAAYEAARVISAKELFKIT